MRKLFGSRKQEVETIVTKDHGNYLRNFRNAVLHRLG